MRTRKKFPTSGIYAVKGLCGSNYLNDEQALRYRYITPASYVQPTNYIGDCWICDKNGNSNPGTSCSPVPIILDNIGRRLPTGKGRSEAP